MLGGPPGFRGRGLPWTYPRSVRTPHRLETLTSTPRRCAPHYPVQSPREGALQTSAPAPRSLLPTPLQPLLPGVTRRRTHVMGRGRGAGRAGPGVTSGRPLQAAIATAFCASPQLEGSGLGGPIQTSLPGPGSQSAGLAPHLVSAGRHGLI